MSKEFTKAEWLAELERLEGGQEGRSAREIQKELAAKNIHISRFYLCNLLRDGVEGGRILCGRAQRPRVDGVKLWVPVYTVVKEGKT